ncbi:hypothetical protein BC826DRAFT_316560 [Russula brevipes]|nr:hypothetical protein BC826DRAFT_316560 [Russula brevipes]
MCLPSLPTCLSCDIQMYQAVKDVGANYDALVDLLESIERFLNRLDIYTKITPTAAMAEMVVKIMVELLSTLALATKQVKQKQPMKLVEKLLGDNEGEAVLQRLDRLTQDEARTTAAQTLEVVYGLMQNMNVGGEQTHALPPSVAPAFVQPSEVMSSPPAFAPVSFPRVLGSSSPPGLAGESDEDLGSESGESEAGDPSDGPDGDDDGDFMPTRSSRSRIRSRRTSSVSSGSGAVRDPRSCRLSAPVPVPNLTKKSRGRRVPTAPVIIVQGGVQKNMRMYRCTVDGCDKCFARGEHLKRHVRSIHTNEKPHKCPVEGCGKDFSRHDNLGQHMRVHKGQAMTSVIGDR